jgi:hypothetical protein
MRQSNGHRLHVHVPLSRVSQYRHDHGHNACCRCAAAISKLWRHGANHRHDCNRHFEFNSGGESTAKKRRMAVEPGSADRFESDPTGKNVSKLAGHNLEQNVDGTHIIEVHRQFFAGEFLEMFAQVSALRTFLYLTLFGTVWWLLAQCHWALGLFAVLLMPAADKVLPVRGKLFGTYLPSSDSVVFDRLPAVKLQQIRNKFVFYIAAIGCFWLIYGMHLPLAMAQVISVGVLIIAVTTIGLWQLELRRLRKGLRTLWSEADSLIAQNMDASSIEFTIDADHVLFVESCKTGQAELLADESD